MIILHTHHQTLRNLLHPQPRFPCFTVSTATKLAVFKASKSEGHISLKLSVCTSTTGTRITNSSSDFVFLLTSPGDKEGMGFHVPTVSVD